MAAGLGFKDFVTGEVLTAADVDGYLMQGVWVFASAAARDAAVTSPQEGNFAYLKDTNVTTYYTGSAWANLDTTGMTNPMTTTGDTIYSSSGSTPARLGIGSTGDVLTVSGGLPVWSAPAGGGGMTLINTGGTTLTGASVTISSIPATYQHLQVILRNALPATDNTAFKVRFNSDSSTNYRSGGYDGVGGAMNATQGNIQGEADNTVSTFNLTQFYVWDYANTTTAKFCYFQQMTTNATTTTNVGLESGYVVYNQTGAISSITLFPTTGNWTSGTAYVYGVK